MEKIELAQLIQDLRSELSAARAASVTSDLRFEIGNIDLELSVAVSREGGPSAKVRFWVVEAGGSAKLGASTTQKIRLTLVPRDITGEKVQVAGEAGEREH